MTLTPKNEQEVIKYIVDNIIKSIEVSHKTANKLNINKNLIKTLKKTKFPSVASIEIEHILNKVYDLNNGLYNYYSSKISKHKILVQEQILNFSINLIDIVNNIDYCDTSEDEARNIYKGILKIKNKLLSVLGADIEDLLLFTNKKGLILENEKVIEKIFNLINKEGSLEICLNHNNKKIFFYEGYNKYISNIIYMNNKLLNTIEVTIRTIRRDIHEKIDVYYKLGSDEEKIKYKYENKDAFICLVKNKSKLKEFSKKYKKNKNLREKIFIKKLQLINCENLELDRNSLYNDDKLNILDNRVSLESSNNEYLKEILKANILLEIDGVNTEYLTETEYSVVRSLLSKEEKFLKNYDIKQELSEHYGTLYAYINVNVFIYKMLREIFLREDKDIGMNLASRNSYKINRIINKQFENWEGKVINEYGKCHVRYINEREVKRNKTLPENVGGEIVIELNTDIEKMNVLKEELVYSLNDLFEKKIKELTLEISSNNQRININEENINILDGINAKFREEHLIHKIDNNEPIKKVKKNKI